MQVEDIQGDDVICTAANHANLDGLVTIFHTERSPDMLNNVQNDLPIMTSDDKARIKEVAAEFEIDFISLSFTRSGEDVQAAREFLDSMNMQTTKVWRPQAVLSHDQCDPQSNPALLHHQKACTIVFRHVYRACAVPFVSCVCFIIPGS